jgi:hypothetical protein
MGRIGAVSSVRRETIDFDLNVQNGGDIVETYKSPVSVWSLGFGSAFLGMLGAAFYWWTPFGMVLSLSGLVIGFIGWTFARRRTAPLRLVMIGMLICVVALMLDSVIAINGLEWIQFQDLR